MASRCKTHGILGIFASSTREARLPGLPAAPFVQALSARLVTLCTKPGADPVHKWNKAKCFTTLCTYSFMYECMWFCDYTLICMKWLMNRQGFQTTLFSSFFFSKDRRIPRVQVSRGEWQWGYHLMTFKWSFCTTRKTVQGKAKLKNFETISLLHLQFYLECFVFVEKLACEGTMSWSVALLLCFKSAQKFK